MQRGSDRAELRNEPTIVTAEPDETVNCSLRIRARELRSSTSLFRVDRDTIFTNQMTEELNLSTEEDTFGQLQVKVDFTEAFKHTAEPGETLII
jgi:hypothetical protein